MHHQGPRDASGTATEVIRRRPGLVASTLVANPDGRRVVNVARWRTSDDARDAGARPGAAGYAATVAQDRSAEPGLYVAAAGIR